MDKIYDGINLDMGSTVDHYKEESLFILDLKICRLGDGGKTIDGSEFYTESMVICIQ